MRALRLAVVITALCVAAAAAKKPKTVDEAVQVLKTKWLKPKDLDWIIRNPKEHVVWTLYRPFGTGVRNEFGLWGNNRALHKSCGDEDPEGCSVVIFDRLWESVRADADPSLVRQLDCQFQLRQSIQISEKGFYKLTTGELLKAIQSQIDQELTKLAATGPPTCQGSLSLEVVGNPDMNCFVDAPFAKDHAEEPQNVTLEAALSGLGSLNLFRSSNAPPKITLEYARKCQFRTPPYLYGSRKNPPN